MWANGAMIVLSSNTVCGATGVVMSYFGAAVFEKPSHQLSLLQNSPTIWLAPTDPLRPIASQCPPLFHEIVQSRVADDSDPIAMHLRIG